MKAKILSATIFSAILLTALVSCTNNNKIESKPSIKSSSYIDSASENKIPTENKEDEVNYLLFENELKSLNYKFVGDRFYSEY